MTTDEKELNNWPNCSSLYILLSGSIAYLTNIRSEIDLHQSRLSMPLSAWLVESYIKHFPILNTIGYLSLSRIIYKFIADTVDASNSLSLLEVT